MLRPAGLFVLLVVISACSGSAPTAGRPEFPLVACPLEGPESRTALPGYVLVAPGTIAFGSNLGWHNVSGSDEACGAQAVSEAASVISLASLDGEDRITWVATLAWPGHPSEPPPVSPTMTLLRLEPAGPVVVQSVADERSDAYSMRGSYGHDAQPGSYVMRIMSANGDLLAEGRFEVVP